MDRPATTSAAAVAPKGRGLGNLARLWDRIEPFLGQSRWRLAGFAATSLLAALGEALLLFAVVRTATAIAAGERTVEISTGALPTVTASTGQLFGWSLALLAGLLALSVLESYLAARMSTVALLAARRRTFDAFLGADWDLQARERNGHLQELLTTSAKKVAQGSLILADGITFGLGFVAFLVGALLISPVAALTILLGVLGLYLALRPLIRLTRSTARSHLASNARYALAVTEAASLARELRAFDATAVVGADIDAHAVATGRQAFATRFLERVTPGLYQNAGLLLVIVGMLGAYTLDVGDLSALGAVIVLLVRALSKSQGVQGAIQRSAEVVPHLESITEYQEQYRRAAVRPGHQRLGPVERLAVRGVSVGYEPGRPVLQDLSFEVSAGQTVGIVGPSGSGKSTLVQLLLRLRAPEAGVVLVNGRPAADYDAASWTSQIAFVPQDNLLLHASVADNVRFFRPDADDEAVERACRQAHLHQEVMALPEGYRTILGSGAHGISGGQRQRLGLARALLGRPSAIVLDEPTSALDLQSEARIQATLDDLQGSVTLFIVAHRLSTIQRCDRIMVLEEGRLAAFGPPADLERSNGFYQEATRLSRLA